LCVNYKNLRNVDEITSTTMHHSFRPPLSDLKSQKYQNSSLFHQPLWSEIEQIRPKSMRLLGKVISSTFLIGCEVESLVFPQERLRGSVYGGKKCKGGDRNATE
jgi:hypothetical protein